MTHLKRDFVLALAATTLGTSCRAIARYVPMAPMTAADSVETTLFLLGDAGDPGLPGRTSLDGLRNAARGALGHVIVAFLGDNAYPNGLPDTVSAGRAEAGGPGQG